jgi:hypothetical protein
MARTFHRIPHPGASCHVIARGHERKAVFRNQMDRNHSLSCSKKETWRHGSVIHVSHLMTNHGRLLPETSPEHLSRLYVHRERPSERPTILFMLAFSGEEPVQTPIKKIEVPNE